MRYDHSKNIVRYQFDSETAREAGRKGSYARSKAIKQRKTISQLAKIILDSDTNPKAKETIAALAPDLANEDMTNAAMLVAAQLKQAVVKGDTRAAQWLDEITQREAAKLEANKSYTLDPLVFTSDFIIPYRRMRNVLEGKDKTLREVIAKGGRGGIKSTWFSEFAYETMMRDPEAHVVYTRRYKTDLKGSVYSQFERTVSRMGNMDDWSFTKSPMQATYKPTGQMVLFLGCDKPISLKSYELPFGHVALLIHEESDEMASVQQMDDVEDTFLRKDAPCLDVKIFNPPQSSGNFMNQYAAEKSTDAATLVFDACYENVPIEWLGQRFFDRAEWFKEHKPTYYANHYRGKVTGTGGELFPNVEYRELPPEAIEFPAYQGLDFGWDHPMAFIICTYDHEHDTIYIIEEHVARNQQLGQFLKPVELYMGNETICDSADPDKIAQMKTNGWNAIGANKRWKGGGLDYSWEWIRSRAAIVVDPKVCPKMAHEFQTLEFPKLSDGTISTRYPDLGEDCVAALRYALNRVIIESSRNPDDW